MAAAIGEDVITRASANAGEQFIEAYYTALHGARNTIATYYMPKTPLPSGKMLPVITYNGTQLSDPDEFQTVFANQMPFTYFEVQSFNATVLNPALAPIDVTKARPKEIENNMSVLVQVSGQVRLVERKEGPLRAFSDNLVLVPNKEEVGAKGKGKTGEGEKLAHSEPELQIRGVKEPLVRL
ncbi:hypothetical protein AAFC00_003713 [Neodothiora populina]|uniref:NTF2 domain-containing protein n=1 Tax=Neodothiora populina TaxID=2781224 RepID=A0ABR3PFN2_9PEZI